MHINNIHKHHLILLIPKQFNFWAIWLNSYSNEKYELSKIMWQQEFYILNRNKQIIFNTFFWNQTYGLFFIHELVASKMSSKLEHICFLLHSSFSLSFMFQMMTVLWNAWTAISLQQHVKTDDGSNGVVDNPYSSSDMTGLCISNLVGEIIC